MYDVLCACDMCVCLSVRFMRAEEYIYNAMRVLVENIQLNVILLLKYKVLCVFVCVCVFVWVYNVYIYVCNVYDRKRPICVYISECMVILRLTSFHCRCIYRRKNEHIEMVIAVCLLFFYSGSFTFVNLMVYLKRVRACVFFFFCTFVACTRSIFVCSFFFCFFFVVFLFKEASAKCVGAS